MGRPLKEGLDYFPLDVTLDDKIELLEADYGVAGFGIYIKLLQKIYANGYFIDWQEDNIKLFAKKTNMEMELIMKIIYVCFKRNLFSKEKFDKYQILTSHGIQKRYIKILKDAKRNKTTMIEEYSLLSTNLNDDIPKYIKLNSEEIPINSELSTQSKVKESKGKKSNTVDDIDDFFESIWELYPNKKGKNSVKTTKRKELYKIGDEIKKCIDRYVSYVKTEHQNGFKELRYKDGSTFFNSGYIDYLDENFDEVEYTEKTIAEPICFYEFDDGFGEVE
jgi:hypothetical protein